MSRRTAAWLAWSVWALCVALAVLALLLDFYIPQAPARHGPNFEVLAGVPLLVYPTVGAFVASRRPKNAAGWVLCGMGLVFEVHALAHAYTDSTLFGWPGSLPGSKVMSWLTEGWLYPGLLVGAVLLFLLFPDSKLLDRALWFVVSMAVGGTSASSIALAVARPIDGIQCE